MRGVILLELNEINFDFVRGYIDRGALPNLERLIREHGLSETTSEQAYEHLEPWIQWVTAHTGLSFEEHGVFRLGDIIDRDIPQIWERLEAKGLKVGAISPMNAKNRLCNASFFVPDPWTATKVSAPWIVRKLHAALAGAVNDNTDLRLTPKSLFWLLLGAVATARPSNYGKYLTLALKARSKPWGRAIFLDYLLHDLFVRSVARSKPDFASLFLNAGAHIQHHYMFSSSVYDGPFRNPEWYIDRANDPVLEVYAAYDRMVGQIVEALPDHRLMIATGLHQNPHPELTYYWRLRDHEAFLQALDAPFTRIEPRMSRDFLVVCDSAENARRTEQILLAAAADDGEPLFEVDNRGRDLFVSLVFPRDVTPELQFRKGNQAMGGLRDHVAFVAVKNGEHDGLGYFIDTGFGSAAAGQVFPLKQLPGRIEDALAI